MFPNKQTTNVLEAIEQLIKQMEYEIQDGTQFYSETILALNNVKSEIQKQDEEIKNLLKSLQEQAKRDTMN